MASASGPAGRPTPSLIGGWRLLSSSDRPMGERQENQMPTAVTTLIEARTTSSVTAALTVIRAPG